MSKVTYMPREDDLEPVVDAKGNVVDLVRHRKTVVAGVEFPADVAVELPPEREWLAEKLKMNPWFKVEQDKPAHEGPSVEQPAPPPPPAA
jgi:hypothetical protein